jgi:hypothetical protein
MLEHPTSTLPLLSLFMKESILVPGFSFSRGRGFLHQEVYITSVLELAGG